MAKENNKKIIALEGEVKTGLKSFAETQALTKSTGTQAPSLQAEAQSGYRRDAPHCR